ncbi:T9SS type B sorting domain-containing protein, partial [Pedobacter agri]
SGNETDPTPGNNTDTVTPIPKAVTVDLSIVKSTPLVVKSIGEQFNYDLTVRNNSTNPATEVMVEDVLPNGLVFISATSNNGTVVYNPATRTLSWNLGQLAAGVSVSLNLNVKTDQAGVVVNTATVSSKEEDTNPADNTSTATKEILGFKIPNVITPDGDGKNDTFRIQGLSAYPENSMVIFNRWGNEVFHSDGAYQNNWTGEGLNAGTYYYLLKIKDSNGNWHAHKGFITLLKKN